MSQDDSPSDIAAVRERLNTSANNAQQLRARLIGHGVIAPVRRGELEFQLPYLREYLLGEFTRS
jgi:hypothetical protein